MTLLKFIDLDDIIIFKSVLDEYDNVLYGMVGALGYAAVKAYMNSRNHRSISDKLKAQIEVREAMRKVTSSTLVERFLFLEIKNGANEVIKGVRKRFRVSVIDECHKDGLMEVKDEYQNLFVDDDYQQMIEDAWFKPYVDYDVSKMKDCDLKRIYEKEGVKFSRIYTIFVNSETKKTYFISVATYNDNFSGDAQTEKELKHHINEIKNSYEFIYN
jgi:hypothetical protein